MVQLIFASLHSSIRIMIYLLFILTIGLSGIVLMQFAYLAFLSANNEQLRKQLNEMSNFKANRENKPLNNQPDAVDETWPEYVENERQLNIDIESE